MVNQWTAVYTLYSLLFVVRCIASWLFVFLNKYSLSVLSKNKRIAELAMKIRSVLKTIRVSPAFRRFIGALSLFANRVSRVLQTRPKHNYSLFILSTENCEKSPLCLYVNHSVGWSIAKNAHQKIFLWNTMNTLYTLFAFCISFVVSLLFTNSMRQAFGSSSKNCSLVSFGGKLWNAKKLFCKQGELLHPRFLYTIRIFATVPQCFAPSL